MKRILCVISCLMLSMSLLAQQDDLVRQIGKVKRDVNYIYAEATMKAVSYTHLRAHET